MPFTAEVLEALSNIAEPPVLATRPRSDFHLPGQHDQQAHAGAIESRAQLEQSSGVIAAAAQRVYDAWDETDADTYAGGGICHLIAEDIASLLTERGVEANTVSQSIDEQHVYVVAKLPDGVYRVDIPPGVYERGGGYSWTKLPEATISAADVIVDRIDANPDKYEEYLDFKKEDIQ